MYDTKQYGTKAIQKNVERQNAEIAAKKKAEQERLEAEQKRVEEARRKRAEFREWATLVLAFIGTLLSIISILWQAPLH